MEIADPEDMVSRWGLWLAVQGTEERESAEAKSQAHLRCQWSKQCGKLVSPACEPFFAHSPSAMNPDLFTIAFFGELIILSSGILIILNKFGALIYFISLI